MRLGCITGSGLMQPIGIAHQDWQPTYSVLFDEGPHTPTDLARRVGTFEDYLAGRDPVLDAVIEESPPGG